MQSINIESFRKTLENKFQNIVTSFEVKYINEFRIHLIDKSFLDIWFSLKLNNRYSYHWENRKVSGMIFRHDNSPHIRWQQISTYPKHFHNESDENVEESFISDNPVEAVIEMLCFIENRINQDS